jgi:uncharacterized membrane protein YagU involved in acid resistance
LEDRKPLEELMPYRAGRTQNDLYDRNLTYHGQFRLEGTGFSLPGDQRIWKGLLSGLAAGLFGTWVMTRYQVNSQKAIQKLQSKSQADPAEETQEPENPAKNPTVAVADRIAQKVVGQAVPADKKEIAGNLVHYGFGTLMGGLYGVLHELWPLAGTARGLAYGAAVWAAVDEIMLPATGLAKWAPEYPAYVHANALGAHLVYAVTVDSARRLVDPLLDRAFEAVQEQRRPGLAEETSSEFRPVQHRRAAPSPWAHPQDSGLERRKDREPAA